MLKLFRRQLLIKIQKFISQQKRKKYWSMKMEMYLFIVLFKKIVFALIHLFISKRTICNFRFLTQGDRNP